MFAALVIERPRLTWTDFLQWPLVSVDDRGLAKLGFGEYWVQWVGGFAAFGLLLWLLAGGYRRGTGSRESTGLSMLVHFLFGILRGRPSAGAPAVSLRGVNWKSPLLRNIFWTAVIVSACAYFPYVAVVTFKWVAWLLSAIGWVFRALLFQAWNTAAPTQPTIEPRIWHRYCFTLGGFAAVVAVLLPFLTHLAELRWRRIWAIARLTVKEVIRRRILWVFAILALVFLFGAWFFDTKPEHQVHLYVTVVYLAMAFLLLGTGSLLAAFSLPTDIRQQTIHTILTKPVERMEIVLGRFLGFTLVMTAAIAVMSAVSLIYILRGVDKDAAEESLRARVPLTGELIFEGSDDPRKGTNVGEEWEYRGYIGGKMTGKPLQYAVWSLKDVPADLANREAVSCEFTFSIYRTMKAAPAEEGKGVFCTFLMTTPFCPLTRSDDEHPRVPARWQEIQAEREQLRRESPPLTEAQIDDRIADKYGVYEQKGKPVFNFHTQSFSVPGGLFRNLLRGKEELKNRLQELQGKQGLGGSGQADEEEMAQLQRAQRGDRGPLKVWARCDSRTQFLGMAQYDLYLLAADQRFELNFFKGAMGLWFWVCLVTGLAIACSTYLSGVITWLTVGFVFLVGTFRDWLQVVSEGKNEGGGPMESMLRLFGRSTPVAPLESTTVTSMAFFSDEVFRWFMKLVTVVFPNVDRYDFSSLVASGFNVSAADLLLTTLYLCGYLLPWLVLAYYLVRSREVATW